MAQSFVTDSPFYPKQHFPYGIARSGEFTRQQVDLLEKHGKSYEALHQGLQKPANTEEEEFVKACKGEKVVSTVHEKVWARYCDKTAMSTTKPAHFSASQAGITEDIALTTNTDDLPDL